MLKLDNNLLDELGLGSLPTDQKQSMLQHIYDTLELRVGTRLANQMTDQQLDEFERFIDAGGDANQAQALQWLEANLPNYKEVVNQVFEELKAEIKQMAPQIMAASAPVGQQPAVNQSVQPQHTTTQPMQPAHTAAPVSTTAQYPGPQSTVAQHPISTDQPDPASYQDYQAAQPLQSPQFQAQPQQQVRPAQGQGVDDAQVYQFPTQQPPAGPGGYHDQRAA